MTTIRNTTEIKLLIGRNPHRYGSMDWFRFEIIVRLGQPATVGEYLRLHAINGNLGTEWNAKRYLRYMVDRRQMELPGVVFTRRGPRVGRDRAPLNLPLLASEIADFTFGVELECFLPQNVAADDVARLLTDEGIDTRVEHLSHGTRSWWKIVTDGSLSDYTRGREFVSPVLQGQAGMVQVELVCRKLAALGCKVNKRCGYHIHVGHVGNSNNAAYFSRMLTMYSYNETLIDSIMAPSRRGAYAGNGFCNAVRVPSATASTVEQVCRSVGADGRRSSARYRKLNVDCWWSQRTIEFRQHQGTVEADRACNWLQFCLHFAKFAASGAELRRCATLDELLTLLDLNDELKTFFLNRAARFAAAIAARAA